jgi:hypothetical protein
MADWFLHALDQVSSVCPEYCLRFWGVVGIWLSAIAMFSATVVALRLARRSRVILKVSAGTKTLMSGDGGPSRDVVVIAVTNEGERDCQIDGIGWKSAPWLNHSAQQSPGPTGPQLPYRMRAGERVSFPISMVLSDGTTLLEDLASDFLGDKPEKEASLLKVEVWTAVGDTAEAPIESDLADKLIAAKRNLVIRARESNARLGPD